MSEPILSVDAILAAVPGLLEDVRRLQAEVEAMRAPVRCSCGSEAFNIMRTITTDQGIRRRRKCRKCGERITTFEVIGQGGPRCHSRDLRSGGEDEAPTD